MVSQLEFRKEQNKIPLGALLIVTAIDLYLLLYLCQVYSLPFQNTNARFAIMIFLFLSVVVSLNKLELLLRGRLWKTFFSYLVFVFIEVIIHSHSTLSSIINELYFPVVFLSAYGVFVRLSEHQKDFIINFQVKVSYLFFILFMYATFVMRLTNGLYLNSCYYSAFFLPFILKSKSKFKFLNIGIAILPALISAKRTTFIAALLAVILYYFADFKKVDTEKTVKNLITLILIFITIYFLINKFNSNLVTRLEGVFSDGGSGRVDAIKNMWSLIKRNSISQHLIGNGVYSLKESAHNDFLDVYWNYGILGFVPYSLIIINLFKEYNVAKKIENEYFPSYRACMIVFITCSLFSQLLFVPSYVGLICMFFALADTSVNKQLNTEVKDDLRNNNIS